ncbi:MarR family protease production transcriptional regulator HPr [Priestia megaterium]|uniref:HTH-type transcriptional regulator Hpr n=1 Tax=Priestia megaterium TaxID=1404 RepID=UPI000BF50C23|nr:HTH-type transcriptional regulator Hpr [Priestia megaterium]MDI3095040.1 HTH-type transcriptional regulator Hpr [Priestia megaterium]PFA94025.1 transcriptional regulator Hpr [Priestia megaterium]
MKSFSEDYNFKEATLFSLQLMQLSRILWKTIENDWENLLKPYGININEHHILSITYNSPYISIMELAEVGSMHMTTAFNFSKRLKQKGYLRIIKNRAKKKNTCIELTKSGEELLVKILKNFKPHQSEIFLGALSTKDLYGKLPNFTELVNLMRNIYGENLIALIDCCSSNIERNLIEEDGVLKRKIDKDVK